MKLTFAAVYLTIVLTPEGGVREKLGIGALGGEGVPALRINYGGDVLIITSD